MSSFAGRTRRGAKARRTTKQTGDRMSSPDFTSEHRPKTDHVHGHSGHQAPQHPIPPAKPARSYAEAAGSPPPHHLNTANQNPTYHTEAQDPGFPHPFDPIPHLQLTGRYSGSTLLQNELVFRNVFPYGQAATRELLQSSRTEAYRALKTQMGFNIPPTDTHGDTVTVVTKRSDTAGSWVTTGDIRVRFASARAAITAYHQQRTQQNKKETKADRLLNHTGQVCHMLIPSGHTNETSQDPTLHKAYASSQMFRGLDNNSISQLFKQSLQAHYELLLEEVGEKEFVTPTDFYSTIFEAIDKANDYPTVELKSPDLLYLFEYLRINKVGGTGSTYVCIEWPGIQIPLAITTLLQDKGLDFPFINNYNEWEQQDIFFYERNPAGRGLDFTDAEDDKEDFLRYAVEYHCLNPIADIKTHPLPALEELVHDITAQTSEGLQYGKEPRKELQRALKTAAVERQWFPAPDEPCQQDLRVNTHLGAGGAMTPGRIQDPEGAKLIVVSYKTAAGAAAAISRQTFKIICTADTKTGRLSVYKNENIAEARDPVAQRRMILVYRTAMHTASQLNPSQCSIRSEPRLRNKWLTNTLRTLEQYLKVDSPAAHFHDYDMETDAQQGADYTAQGKGKAEALQPQPLQQQYQGAQKQQQYQTAQVAGISGAGTGAPLAQSGFTPAQAALINPQKARSDPTAAGAAATSAAAQRAAATNNNRFAPLAEEDGDSGGQGSEPLSSGVLRDDLSSNASSSRGRSSRGREPVTLTPDILQLLDRYEPDKARHAQLLMEHMTGHRTLPRTEEELTQMLERKANRELKRQQAAALAAANQAAAEQAAAEQRAQAAQHAALMAQQAMADALAAGATNEAAIAAGEAAKAAAQAGEGSATMQD
jgi:hypothetical protein